MTSVCTCLIVTGQATWKLGQWQSVERKRKRFRHPLNMQVNHNWFALVTVELADRCHGGACGVGWELCPLGQQDEGAEEEEDKSSLLMCLLESHEVFLFKYFSCMVLLWAWKVHVIERWQSTHVHNHTHTQMMTTDCFKLFYRATVWFCLTLWCFSTTQSMWSWFLLLCVCVWKRKRGQERLVVFADFIDR